MLLTESQLYIFSLLILLIFIFEVQLSLIAVNVKYFYFAFRNSFCNIQPILKILFWRKSIKLLKLEAPLFCLFYKIKIFGIQFSVCFVSFESISSISKNLYQHLLICHCKNPKKSRNINCYKKQFKNVCQLKLFLREMNHLLVLIRTHSHLIYKMIYRFFMKLSNLKKHPFKITFLTTQLEIIGSTLKIRNVQMLLLTESQRKINIS